MGIFTFLNDFNFYIQLKLFFIEEIVVVFMFYNFIKLIIFSSIVELIWPTQFFNKKHGSSYQLLKFRTFNETLLKLRLKNHFYIIFNKSILKYIFIKNVFKSYKIHKKIKIKKKN